MTTVASLDKFFKVKNTNNKPDADKPLKNKHVAATTSEKDDDIEVIEEDSPPSPSTSSQQQENSDAPRDVEKEEKSVLMEKQSTAEVEDSPAKTDVIDIDDDDNEQPSSENASENAQPGADTLTTPRTRKRRQPEPGSTPSTPSQSQATPGTPQSAARSSCKKLRTASAERKRQEANRLREKEREERAREKAEKEAEKQRQKEEKERQRQAEKEEKERQRLQEKEERERKKAEEREEKERQRLAEKAEKERLRLEKEKQKAEEREQKEDEKRRQSIVKEQQRLEKEEKRKKQEEERLAEKAKKDAEKAKKDAEEAARLAKLERQKQMLRNFIVKKDPEQQSTPTADLVGCGGFQAFQLKESMVLAPLARRHFTDENKEHMDKCLVCEEALERCSLYVQQLRSGAHRPLSAPGTAGPLQDIQLIDAKPPPRQRLRAKLLQFHENCRPAYYGTYRKKSSRLSGRRPWARDANMFDYDVDSDDEWEEEPEDADECVSDDDKADNDEEKIDDSDDDGFFVAHGYLSEGEGDDENEQEEINEKERRERLDAKARAWAAEKMSKNFAQLKPYIIGPIWQGDMNADELLIEKLMSYRMWPLCAPVTSYNYAEWLQTKQQAEPTSQPSKSKPRTPKTVEAPTTTIE